MHPWGAVMADGNGSIADREDNKSLDAADSGSSGSNGGGSNSMMGASEQGGRYTNAPGRYEARVIDTPLSFAGSVQANLPGRQVDFSHSSLQTIDNLTGDKKTVGLHEDGTIRDDTRRTESLDANVVERSLLTKEQYDTLNAALDQMIGTQVAEYNAMFNNCHEFAVGLFNATVFGNTGPFQDFLNSIGGESYNPSTVPGYEPGSGHFGLPIVLDLDGDGLDLVALDKSKAMYDIDGDGYLENVGWVGDGDGFLSIDLNGDGLILDPKELAFALSTEDPDDTDLEGLAATYDSNKDGVLDANDAEFAKFKVWRDIDQDGVCDAGEVKSLAEHGITSVNLTSDKKEEVIAGNKVYGSTTYTKTDGTTGKVGDVGLATSAAGWKREEVSGGIKFNYEGTGDNAGRALFEAAAATALIMDVAAAGLAGAMGAELNDSLSTSGDKDVLLGGGAGNDTLTGGAGNDWLAGGEGIDSLNGGAGHDILFVDSQDKIQGGAGFDVAIVTDDKAVSYDLAKIGIEAVSAGAGDDVLNANGVATSVVLDGGKGDDTLTGGKGDDILSGGEGEDIFKGGKGDDLIIMDADDKFEDMDGGAGWDRVVYLGNQDLTLNITDYNVEFFQAGDGNDVIKTELDIQTDLDGGGGNDTMTGGWAGDFLAGGKGNDRLEGGYGNDTYQFSRGDGADTVKDMYIHEWKSVEWQMEQKSVRAGNGDGNTYVNEWKAIERDEKTELNAGDDDKIAFGPGIGVNDVMLQRVGNDLIIALKDPSNPNADFSSLKDRITVEDWSNGMHKVESIAFADGTKLELDTLIKQCGVVTDGAAVDIGAAMAADYVPSDDVPAEVLAQALKDNLLQVGTRQGDVLGGGDKNDVLDGGKGSDTAAGGKGDDWIMGGEGSDSLAGGAGKDKLFGGDGNDVVSGGEGDDELVGGAGKDTAYYLGNKADYDIKVNDDGSLTVKFIGKDEPPVEGEAPRAPKVNEGTDHLTDIETLKFADGEVKVEPLVTAAAAAKAEGVAAPTLLAGPMGGAKLADLDEDEDEEKPDLQNRMMKTRLPEMSISGGSVAMAAALGIAATGAATALAAAEAHSTGVATAEGDGKAVVQAADVNAIDLAPASSASGLSKVDTGATTAASHVDGKAVIDATAGSTRYLDNDPRPLEDVVYERTMISMGYGPDRFNYDEPSYNDRLIQVGRELFGANWAVGDSDAAAPLLSAGDVVGVEDGWIKLEIKVGLSDTDGSEVLLPIRISGVPAGAILSAGKEVAPGIWEVSAGALGNLKIKPAPNDSHDFNLTVQATSYEQVSGATTSVTASCVVEVAATVDEMISLVAQNSAGLSSTSGDQVLTGTNGGNVLWGGGGDDILSGMGGNDVLHGDDSNQTATAQLNLSAIIPDPGDVQGFWVTVSGLPAGATVMPGIDLGNGTWRIGGLDLGNVNVNWPAGSGDLTLNAYATGFDIDPDTGDMPTKDGPTVSLTITASDTLGNDILTGGAGNDTLISGGGSDSLSGGANNDTYVIGSEDGATVNAVIHNDAVTDAGENDTLKLLSGLSPEDIWFQKQGADLIVKLLDGSNSTITIADWYSSDNAKLDSITITDGEHLDRSKVDQLVQEMANYGAPPAPDAPLPQTLQTAIDDAWEP